MIVWLRECYVLCCTMRSVATHVPSRVQSVACLVCCPRPAEHSLRVHSAVTFCWAWFFVLRFSRVNFFQLQVSLLCPLLTRYFSFISLSIISGAAATGLISGRPKPGEIILV